MKKKVILFLVMAFFTIKGGESNASWLIDMRQLLSSAHPETGCQECHEDIDIANLHPNPADVTKKMMDFFDIDECLLCHDEVMEKLNEGLHGAENVKEPETYEDCLRCHHPHYMASYARNGETEVGQSDSDTPGNEQCDTCPEQQTVSTDFSPSPEDEKCLTCHGYFSPEDFSDKEKIFRLCFECHGSQETEPQVLTGNTVPFIVEKKFRSAPHADVSCLSCHLQAAKFSHRDIKLEDCRECHPPHDEKISNDAHADVTCQACHLEEILPIKDPKTKAVRWERTSKPGMNSRIHLLVSTTGETYCQRCHFSGNPVGAVSMILPAKSILCMPCHAATFSAGDTTTVLSLIVFLSGLVLTVSIWLSGSRAFEKNVNPFSMAKVLAGRSAKAIFSQKSILILKSLFYDIFLQKRLYKRSARRWIIHSLIFFPFVFRLGWGFVGLLASIWLPDVLFFWPMLDKNHSTTGFLFDLTGIMIVLGVVLALIRGSSAETEDIRGLPRQDRLALILIGGIVLVGFVLEGIRIAMTGYPENSGYAVVGYGIGKLFSGMTGLTEVFGYVWYAHAVLSGAFIAYLPFSHLKHIIMAPVIMVVHAAADRN